MAKRLRLAIFRLAVVTRILRSSTMNTVRAEMIQSDIPEVSATSNADELICDATVAAMIGVKPRIPAQWRYLGKFKLELPYYKIGRTVRYRRGDVASFVQHCKVGVNLTD
jgi:hypothetical protein